MREHRLSYSSPAGNIASGVIAVPAGHTPKLGLGLPVSFIDTAASWTLTACIAWIDSYHRHTSTLGLNPCANAFEIFQGNSETGAFCSGNDAFGYTVVLMFLEPLLFTANLPKTALSGLCAVARRWV